jgi:hypothetical protein
VPREAVSGRSETNKERCNQLHSQRTKLTPPQLARQWGIDTDKVLVWIRNGELRAINAATRLGGRPRYLIDVCDIEAFEARRVVQQPQRVVRKRTLPGYVRQVV